MLASFFKFIFNLYFLLFFGLVFFGCENSFSSSDKTYIDVLPCVPKTSISTLEIATWNLRNFPLNDKTTEYLDDIIRDMGIDIIAVQEIKSVANLQKVIAKLPGWDFKITSDEELNIGFLFNSLEVEIDNFEVLFDDQWYAFPRPLVMARAKTRANSSEILLFNIHLKCCGGEENIKRRETALNAIKNLLDSEFSNQKNILLGDFNQHLNLPDSSIYTQFLKDEEHYYFSDIGIAIGASDNWSYPSYPSHLDHIIISDELFEFQESVETVRINDCFTEYSDVVSDHLPVMIRLSN